jgi:hypothetical protein
MYSHCNISATDAENSTEGLFRYHTPERVGRPHVKVNLEGMHSHTEYVECLLTDYHLWPHALNSSPLIKRGWVFQERYLAPRVLHFCRNQLFWECREHTVCETYFQELPLVSLHFTAAFPKSKERNEQRIAQQTKVDVMNATNWEDLWSTLVWMYSGKNLSVPGDKLVALSGVAKYVMPHIGDAYVVGMWRRNLEKGLMWTKVGPGSRPSEYRAPSWSWASVDGPVGYGRRSEAQSLIHVKDVVLDYTTEDHTGAVKGGWLDLRGSLKPMKLYRRMYDAEEKPIFLRRDLIMAIDNTLVCSQDGSIREAQRKFPLLTIDTSPVSGTTFNDDNASSSLFFVPSVLERGVRGSVICLMIRLVDEENNLFERIGVAMAGPHTGRDQLLAELDEETKAHLPCLCYENGLHTIRII